MSDAAIRAARQRADAAREELLETAHALQARLKPAALALQAKVELKRKSEDAAETAIEAIKRRPVAFGAAATGVVALLAAGPAIKLARRLRNKDDAGA